MSGEIATPVAVNSTPALNNTVAAPRTRFRHKTRLRLGAAGARLQSVAARLSQLPWQLPWQRMLREGLMDLRLPGTSRSPVRLRRLVGVCAWALLLGLIGMVIGARILFGIFTEMPLWYVTLLFALGIPGVAAAIGAFLTLHKSQVPWKLMGIASAAEALTVIATILS